MYTYKYKVILHNMPLVGYINACDFVVAKRLVKSISSKIIYLYRCWVVPLKTSRSRMVEWFGSISLLMKQGIKVEEALEVMGKDNKYRLSFAILELLKSGLNFSQAIETHGFFFGKDSVSFANSVAGFMKIEGLCDFLHCYNLKVDNQSTSVRRASLPPFITMVAALSVMFSLIMVTKDPMQSIIKDLNIPSPWILDVFDGLHSQICALILLGVCLCIFLVKNNLHHLPIFSAYYQNRDIFISFYCIGNSLRNGVQVLDSIALALMSVKTDKVRNILYQLRKDLLKGELVNQSLCRNGIQDKYTSILRIYELSGELGEGFLRGSEVAERCMGEYFRLLSAVIGPIVTLLTVVCILGFLGEIILPIYSSFSNFAN